MITRLKLISMNHCLHCHRCYRVVLSTHIHLKLLQKKIKPNHPAVVTSRPTPTTPAGITPQPWGITPLPLARCAPPFHTTTTIIHPPTTATCVLHEAQLYLPIVDACFPPIQHPLNPLSSSLTPAVYSPFLSLFPVIPVSCKRVPKPASRARASRSPSEEAIHG